jgi:hypothetical protein
VHIIQIFNVIAIDMHFLLSKMAFVSGFQHTLLWKIIFFSMLHTSFGYEICRHIPNSIRNKNMMSQNPYLLKKLVFLASKTLLSPSGIGQQTFLSTLNIMILQAVRIECVRFS